MQVPTIAEIETAIGVLLKFGERLNAEATNSIIQMPETPLSAYYAGNIRTQTLDQTIRIGAVAAQLKNWQEELLVPQNWCVESEKTPVENKTSVENQWNEKEAGFQKSWSNALDLFQNERDWFGRKLPFKERKAA